MTEMANDSMSGNCTENFPRTGADEQVDAGLREMGAAPEQVARRIRNRTREREQLKSLGFRGLVSSPRGYSGAMPPIANLAPETWAPRHVCALTMDKALREMEFPSRLAGAEWVLP